MHKLDVVSGFFDRPDGLRFEDADGSIVVRRRGDVRADWGVSCGGSADGDPQRSVPDAFG